jgi:GTPase SAR1 family protein
MSCCARDAPDDAVSKDIDKQIKTHAAKSHLEVKLLLLGTGESGKSTIVKQMKLLYQTPYTEQEAAVFRTTVFSNIVTSMKTLLQYREHFGIPLRSPAAETAANELLTQPVEDADVQNFGRWISTLWADGGIQDVYSRSSEFHLNDSAAYYFAAIDRICQPNYIPDSQDILRSRIRTTGIVESQFTYSDLSFRLFDVGGQRNERKKWIHCFQEVTAVIFVVGISEYDQKLLEDRAQNRMIESLWLFDEICNSRWFHETNMILFLNKVDIFEDKLCNRKIPLTVCFQDYTEGFDLQKAQKFVQSKFQMANKNPAKQVYDWFTNATSTEGISTVFIAVKDTILQNRLRRGGFM